MLFSRGKRQRYRSDAEPPPVGVRSSLAIKSELIPAWWATNSFIQDVRVATKRDAEARYKRLSGGPQKVCLSDLLPPLLGLTRGWRTPLLRCGEWVTYWSLHVPDHCVVAFYGAAVAHPSPAVGALSFHYGVGEGTTLEELSLEKLYASAPIVLGYQDSIPPQEGQVFGYNLPAAGANSCSGPRYYQDVPRMEGFFQSPMIFGGVAVSVEARVLGNRDMPEGEVLILFAYLLSPPGMYLSP